MIRIPCALSLLLLVGCSSACSVGKGKKPEPTPPQTTPAPNTGMKVETLNALLEDLWKKEGVSLAPEVNDAEFLRRVTLDTIGRIPTEEEARGFLDDKSQGKREALLDRLLASPEYAQHWADIYVDLTVDRQIRKLAAIQSPREYFVQSFSENKPYNQMASELLTATGDVKDNGAVAFIASQARTGGPEKVAASTATLFLGLQIQCAQCHDHPYDDRYKQEDFYGLVAYFSQSRAKPDKQEKSFELVDVGRGEAKMKRPGETTETKVAPKFLGRALTPKGEQTRRQVLSEAIVSSDLFAKSFVNRTWALLFGRGIMEPYNDLGGENDQNHPELLVKLSKDFVDSGYNQKALLKKIFLSKAYQRSSRGEPNPKDDPNQKEHVFARATVRPLSPEQLFNSLFTATNIEQMAMNRMGNEEKVQKMKERALKEYEFVFGDDEMVEVSAFNGNIPQALLLLNGEITNRGSLARAGSRLEQILAASKDQSTRLESIFLTLYSRRPTDEEKKFLGEFLAQNGEKPQAYEDIFFSLLTSTEFVTNH